MRNMSPIALFFSLFYVMQLALIGYWCSIGSGTTGESDLVFAITLSVALGITDLVSARYLKQAIKRSDEANAADINERLEQSFDEYRDMADAEARAIQRIGGEVEAELAKARTALASSDFANVTKHLAQSVDRASSLKLASCGNAAIAAVLRTKERQCEEAGVKLDIRAQVPDSLPVADVDIAAMLFNLIDNALNECRTLIEEGKTNMTISVSVLVQASQLFVEVTNPCRDDAEVRRGARHKENLLRRHGWGIDIVEGIARDHGGITEHVAERGVFTARVMVPLR